MSQDFSFTSESVSSGHPDKLADQISDAIVDQALTSDPNARVACETLIKMDMVLIAGELTTNGWIDFEKLTRDTIKQAGYDTPETGLDAKACAILNIINQQSLDIAAGIHADHIKQQGAGDQGFVFGYATNETPSFMPAPIFYAHELMKQQALIRRDKILSWLGPDAKSQITLSYKDGKPTHAEAIVLSTQHEASIDHETVKKSVMEHIIKPVIPSEWLSDQTRFLINPTGRFVIGGPLADCGLTGRKTIVDTYGGMARHGGGAFSGKDPSKIDRSAAYMARYIAKNLVAAGVADRLEIQIAYAIGIADPLSIYVETFGTGKLPDHNIISLIQDHFDLRPAQIIQTLNLLQPIYAKTATYGHFGRSEFPWEQLDKVEALKNEL